MKKGNDNGARPVARELREGFWVKPTTKPPPATAPPAPRSRAFSGLSPSKH